MAAPAPLRFNSTHHRFHATATTAMIGIPAFPTGHCLPSARPGATSAARLRTLPRWRPLFSCSSASPPRGRPASSSAAAALKHGSTDFMGSARNGAPQRPSSSSDLRCGLIVPSAGTGGASATATSGSNGPLSTILGVAHLLVSLGIVLAADKYLKQAFVAASIKFPSALFGMFCVFSVLVIFDTFAPALAKAFMDFFEPATMFIQRWLPLFYVPSLVVLPLAVKDIPAASGLKIFLITFGGWFASLAVAGYTALAVRKLVKTQLIPAEPMSKPSPFSTFEIWAWAAIFIASFGVAYFNPTALGTTARTSLPFLLAATVLGYMVGSGLPAGVKKVLHPIISCALSADLAAVAYSYVSGCGLDAVLGDYLTKSPSNPGAGDVLMGFLGSVIISFAFSMFKQRKLVKRHAAEIFTSIALASTFSLYSTAVIGRLIGLEPTLTISILPRCITVALALSIVSFFEGVNSSLTAAVVVLTGLIGANFVQAAMDKLGLKDPIARGIGTASSAHGLGTAALSAKEPEALPFCAIAYGLTGIFGSLLCSVPAVLGVAHLLVSLGIVLATDKFLKEAFVAASIKFPSSLFGMLCVFSALVVFDIFVPALAKAFTDFFEPATLFIQRWLPLFYVPSLVVLPLAVRDIPAASGLKIFFITFGGWFASLAVAGCTALAVRKLVKTQLIPAEPMSKPPPFSASETWAWAAVFVASFGIAYFNPTALGTTARTCLPFLLAATVLGYMVGSGLPPGVKKVLHPIISCALSAYSAAAAYGRVTGCGADAALGDYLTKAPSNPGAGDVLMGFLGSVIISFAFAMFKQRKLVKRHAAEIFTSIAIASTFSLYSTAVLGRLIGLEPTLTISILPRCITLALALSIVSFFEGIGANSSLTAAVVVLTGLIGANFVQAALDRLGLNDPIARGIGTASSAQGFGTAALSSKEPEALPFCAIAYGFTGIFGSLICSVPAVRQSLIFIAG